MIYVFSQIVVGVYQHLNSKLLLGVSTFAKGFFTFDYLYTIYMRSFDSMVCHYLIWLIMMQIPIVTLAQKKAVFIILDGISADVVEREPTPALDEIAKHGGYTRAWLGGVAGEYNESPTISAVGYNHVLTGTWSNKHNVWDNDIEAPNYHYWNIFRIVKNNDPSLKTAIFSSWLDNRTKLVGEGLPEAGSITFDHAFDGFELDQEKFPHTQDRSFMLAIDEHVSTEAARYIAQNGPDLSWVYLEYTDDMGHLYGDSPQYFDAVRKADAQVGKIWNAIRKREQQYGEEWMIVITTDHGRDADTGKHHGGQSERERTVWIVTNASNLNKRFANPASVDIMPGILRFMEIEPPVHLKQEFDGVPFVGPVSVSNLVARKKDSEIVLHWQAMDSKGEVEIFLAASNNFKSGGMDRYTSVGKVRTRKGNFTFTVPQQADFYKILLVAPYNTVNTWIKLKDDEKKQ